MSAPTIATPRSQRISAFDGTRGVLSLFVMLWHCFLLLSPGLVLWSLQHRDSALAQWWFASDPNEILTTAIVSFFILSGIVLTLPAMRAGFSWGGYYSSRLLRLYIPAWAALILGTLLIVLIPRGHAPAGTWLGGVNATHVGIQDLLWQATLLTQAPTIDNPLWSISWEVIFSLLLPLFVLVAVKTTRAWIWMLVGCVLVSGVGIQVHILALMYMPTFLIGAVMAANIDKFKAMAAFLNAQRLRTLWWWLVVVVSLICIWGSRFTDQLDLVKPYTLINHVLDSLFALGFFGFIFIAMGNRTAVRFLCTRVIQYAGRVSYSLYLVHVPILATLGFLFLDREWVAPLIGIPLSILVAILFSRFVEFPAHRLAKALGRGIAARAIERRGRSAVSAPEREGSGA